MTDGREGQREARQRRTSGEERNGCVGVHRRKKAECLQKMVAVYLPGEEGVSQRLTERVSHRILKFQQRNWGTGFSSPEGRTEEKRPASAVGTISKQKLPPKRQPTTSW